METDGYAMTALRAIGLMSGTSLDGVDVALIETDGERVHSLGPSASHPYSARETDVLRRALEDARSLTDRGARPGALGEAETLVTALHAAAVQAFLDTHGIDRARIDVVGFHGHTVLHLPNRGLTVQIGDGQRLARSIGLPVVWDFRAADVAAGGEGAPLVPVFHQALARGLDRPYPVCVLNVGGVANVTFIDGEREPIACDTGPGNALIDDLMRERTGAPLDHDGRTAAAGRVNEAVLERLLAHPFFGRRPPKSLDRNDFRAHVAAEPRVQALPLADAAATLTAFTAASVGAVIPVLPHPPRTWIVAGGGAHNATLMRMLAARLAPATVEPAHAVGWSTNALEAQAFAYLSVRSLKGLAITFPGTTGAPRPLGGGVLSHP